MGNESGPHIMRVLVISQYYQPDITAAANRISETVSILAELENRVTVITTMPHKSDVSFSEEDDQGIPIIRIDISASHDRAGIIGLLAQYFTFSLRATYALFRNYRKVQPEVIWISSPPLPITIASILAKIFLKVPVVLDVRDIWPESAVNIGKIRHGSLFEKLGLWLEVLAYRYADAITCVSTPMADYLRSKTSTPVTVIYNSILEADVPGITNECDTSALCYAGNLGHAQDIELVVEAFAGFIKKTPKSDAKLWLVGDGVLRDDITALVNRLKITDRVTFFGAVPKHKAQEIMLRAGCLLLPLKDRPAFRITVPSKVFDYMATGRPIITNISGEGVDLINKGCGNFIATPGCVNSFEEGLGKYFKEKNFLLNSAVGNVSVIKGDFVREKQTRKLMEVFQIAAQT